MAATTPISNTAALTQFFLRVTDGLIKDAQSKDQKIPISSLRWEADEISGVYFAAHYFKYLIYGRGPGKQPPPETMLKFVRDNPDILARFRQVFKYLTEKGLAYIIGRKIGRVGTDIYLGKKEGIDLLGVMEKNMPALLEQLTRNEVFKVATDLKLAVQKNAK